MIENCAVCNQPVCTSNCCYDDGYCAYEAGELTKNCEELWFCSEKCHQEWHEQHLVKVN